MRRARSLWGLAVLFALGAYLVGIPAQTGVEQRRPELYELGEKGGALSVTNVAGPTPVLIAALGGFRTVAADLLWLKVEQLWDGGSWYLLPSVMESVVQLDPHFVLAWQIYGWHLAYNLNAESTMVQDRHAWLDDGVKVLERGVKVNPDSFDMTFELAWTLFDRKHDLYPAAEYFRQATQQPGAKSYAARLYYRPYERLLDFDKLDGALQYAKSQFPDDAKHQRLVARDIDWWKTNRNNPMEHRRQIARENSDRKQRTVPFHLYPDDPYWNVCPMCGLPTKKGEAVCSAQGDWNFDLQAPVPTTGQSAP